MDRMVLETQKWLNSNYGNNPKFIRIEEDGYTGWKTIRGLIRALQIELHADVDGSFGPGTASKFQSIYPNGIKEQKLEDKTENNIYRIIQGALWCKGYSVSLSRLQNIFIQEQVMLLNH